jgi:hypothetical protein
VANLSQTISNSIVCFGIAETQKWGSSGLLFPMIWGSSLWGERAVFTQYSLGITVSNTLDFISDVAKNAFKAFSVSLDSTMDMGSETLQSQNGYYYVFTYPSANAENRPENIYSQLTVSAAVYLQQAATSTTWSSA